VEQGDEKNGVKGDSAKRGRIHYERVQKSSSVGVTELTSSKRQSK